MILALDVHYKENYAKVVGVVYDEKNEHIKKWYIKEINSYVDYIPGKFYKKELPCLTAMLEEVPKGTFELIIIDGYVYVNNELSLGLGGYLYHYLDKKIPIIGVAKNYFQNNQETVAKIYRGSSMNPLYISSIGINLLKAAEMVKGMNGPFRIPDTLKQLDMMTKDN